MYIYICVCVQLSLLKSQYSLSVCACSLHNSIASPITISTPDVRGPMEVGFHSSKWLWWLIVITHPPPPHHVIHTYILPYKQCTSLRSPSRRSPRFCALVCVHLDLLGFDSRAEVDNGVCVCVAQECPSFIIMCWISEAVQTKDKRVQESRKWNEI